MSRLPIPGQDVGTWGNVLNDYLGQSLAADGTLQPNSVGTAQLANSVQMSLGKADGAVQKSNNLSDVVSPGAALANLGGASVQTATAVKTSAYTASANQIIPTDATSGTVSITLPTAPADTTRVTVKKIDSSTNAVSIVAGGSDVFNKAGGSTSLSLSLLNQTATIQYSSTAAIWYVVGDDLPFSSLQAQFDPAGAAAAAASGAAISVASYGAVGNAQTVNNVAAASASKTVTVTGSTLFKSGDVGKTCVVYNRYSGVGVITTIATFVSSSQVTLTANAGITGSGTDYFFTWGTDDSAAIQSALNAAAAKVWNGTAPNESGFNSSGLVDVVLPSTVYQSGYLVTSQLTVPTGVRIDVPGMLYNAMPSRLAPVVKFADYSGAKQFNLNGLFGGGIFIGTPSTYATAQFESIRIWNCAGTSTAPTSLAGTPSTSGGALTANTYYYIVTGIDSSGGESLVSNEISVTTTGSTSSVALTWTTNAAFTSYRVYRGFVSRGEYKYYGSISSGSFTDIGSTSSTLLMPTPPGTAIAFFGYHLEVGRAYIVNCGCAVANSGNDQYWGFLDMIGCTTGFRGFLAGDIHAPATVVDTCGGTNSISGYVTEGGIFFDLNAGFITMTVTCFSANVLTLSPVVTIGPILTKTQTGTTNNTMDIRIHANNLGGTVLKLSNVVDSKFEVLAANDLGYGFPSNPITTALAYGSNVGPTVNVKMTVATGITAFTGTQAGLLEVAQNGTLTAYPVVSSTSPNIWLPSDHGLVAWAADPYEVTGAGAPVAGTLYLTRLKVRSSATITYLWWWCNAVGATFASGQNLSGLYDTSGNLLSGSADFGSATPSGGSGNLATLGWCKVPLTTPQTVTGDVYAAFVINATTMPQIARGPGTSSTNGFANIGLSTGVTATANSRFISYGTGLTALPATVSFTSGTSPASSNYYSAVS